MVLAHLPTRGQVRIGNELQINLDNRLEYYNNSPRYEGKMYHFRRTPMDALQGVKLRSSNLPPQYLLLFKTLTVKTSLSY